MPTTGNNLGLTVSDTQGATGWNGWHNLNWAMLDRIIQLDVISRALTAPPGSPVAGDRYLVAASPTGDWSGHAGQIAVWGGSWVFYTPKEGWLLTSQADPGVIYKHQGGAFIATGRTLSDFKDSCRVATTANITLSGTQTIDGVAVVVNDSVLVKNQTTGSENGIYLVKSGAWTRRTDFDEVAEVSAGCLIPVTEGTAGQDKLYTLTTNDPITIGTTSITFAVFGAGAGALDDLSDVVITSPASGQVLEHNGTNFVNVYPKAELVVAVTDESTAITVGTAKVTFRMPYPMTLTGIRASLTVAQSSGSIFTVDVNEAGATILSTKITIDNTEKTSTTAATAPVISDVNLADDAEISVDVDQIGDGTAKGLKIILIGRRAA